MMIIYWVIFVLYECDYIIYVYIYVFEYLRAYTSEWFSNKQSSQLFSSQRFAGTCFARLKPLEALSLQGSWTCATSQQSARAPWSGSQRVGRAFARPRKNMNLILRSNRNVMNISWKLIENDWKCHENWWKSKIVDFFEEKRLAGAGVQVEPVLPPDVSYHLDSSHEPLTFKVTFKVTFIMFFCLFFIFFYSSSIFTFFSADFKATAFSARPSMSRPRPRRRHFGATQKFCKYGLASKSSTKIHLENHLKWLEITIIGI